MTTHCVTLCYAHCHQNRIYPSSLSLARDHTKLVSEVHKLHLAQWLGLHIHDLRICGNVLELHNSLLHHIMDILIFDLYVLGLVTINTSYIHI